MVTKWHRLDLSLPGVLFDLWPLATGPNMLSAGPRPASWNRSTSFYEILLKKPNNGYQENRNVDQSPKINTLGIYDSVRFKYESSLDMESKKARGMSTFNTLVIPLFMGKLQNVYSTLNIKEAGGGFICSALSWQKAHFVSPFIAFPLTHQH